MAHVKQNGEEAPPKRQRRRRGRRLIPGTGLIRTFSKTEAAADDAVDMSLVREVYQDAIEVAEAHADMRGGMLTYSILALIMFLVLFFLTIGYSPNIYIWVVIVVFGVVGPIGFVIFAIYLELRAPLAGGILFDRKNRQVCFRTIDEREGGFFGRKAGETHCFDWDCIQVQEHAELQVSGVGASRAHFLYFAVQKSKDDPTIVDGFMPWSMGMLPNERVLAMFYEFLRRYMEEDGMPLTHTVQTCPEPYPRHIGDSWLQSTPFGPRYRSEWRMDPVFMVIWHLILPVALLGFVIRAFCHWLAYATAIRIDWSPQVKARIGEPLSAPALKQMMAEKYNRRLAQA